MSPKSAAKKTKQPAVVEQVPEATIEEVEEIHATSSPVPEEIGVPAEIDAATMRRAADLVRDQTRGEKKARKVFEGLGLSAVHGVTRVVLRRPRNELIVIAEPEVYKSANADVYIVYGVASMASGAFPTNLARDRLVRQQQAMAAAAGRQPHVHTADCNHGPEGHGHEDDEIPDLEAEEEDANDAEDEADDAALPDGVSEKEIALVVKQTGASRGKAIATIKACNGDVASAIMQLMD
ncbi:GAL4 enhancer protein [Blastocladiella emersonii ATCC 22665]|nr:GAL4 enhancer protein [Blastocladiella emersonii ATCC 22665]